MGKSLGHMTGKSMATEPSDWYITRLIIEREGYHNALQAVSDARRGYETALMAAHEAGWTWRALGARLGVDYATLHRAGAREARRRAPSAPEAP